MRLEMLLPLALLFIAHGVPSNAQTGEGAAELAPVTAASVATPAAAAETAAGTGPAGDTVLYYDVGRTFTINCTAPRSPAGGPYVWKINGTEVTDEQKKKGNFEIKEAGSVLAMKGRTSEDDFGNYSCVSDVAQQTWQVRGRPYVKLPDHANVVEGQKLKIVCKLVGKPYPAVAWSFSNTSNGNAMALDARGGRVRLVAGEQGVADAVLQLEAAERSDEGFYWCSPEGGVAAATRVYVKDKYAALWPFLGICAEVFVLCAIILVYEKRRTKPELDDSDTDNHDQKKS